jgi:hypothetical protein
MYDAALGAGWLAGSLVRINNERYFIIIAINTVILLG